MSDISSLFDLHIQAYLQGPLLLAALAAFGLVVGVLTGLFGVGGAFIVTPLLNVGFGIPYELAIGSSLSFTVGTSSSAVGLHVRLGHFEPRSTFILAAASILGAWLGATCNTRLSDALGKHHYTLLMHALFVVMLVVTAWLVGRGRPEGPRGASLLQRLPIGPYIDLPQAGLKRISATGMVLVGLGIGAVGGMMGIGGGVLFMPLLILVVGLTAHQAVGTSLGVVAFSSVAGTVHFALEGHVNLCIVMALLVSSVIGVQIGAWACHRLHAARLQRYFAVLVALVAVCVAVELVRSLMTGVSH